MTAPRAAALGEGRRPALGRRPRAGVRHRSGRASSRAVARQPGERLPSDWWRVEDDGRVVGYGWLDDVWGDAEILLAVEESARGTGAGAFALARLEEEAAARGLNYVVNVVRDTHPDRDAVTGVVPRARVQRHRGRPAAQAGRRPGARHRPAPGRAAGHRPGPAAGRRPPGPVRRRAGAGAGPARGTPSDTAGGSDLGPGAEESGGYVDPEHHRF